MRLPPGSRLQLRRGQSLAVDRIASDETLRVERGCLVMQATADQQGHRSVLLVLLPGDIIVREVAPPLPGVALVAALPSALSRATATGGAADGALNCAAFAKLTARVALHTLALGALDAEQRAVTFLVELALRIGHHTPSGCTFELPLSRTDMARFLALNPDTMSRIMSRLRERKLIAMPSRGLASVPDIEALAALTPLAPVLRRMWPESECAVALQASTPPQA